MKAGWRKDYIFLNVSMPRGLVTRFEEKRLRLRLHTNAAVVLALIESALDENQKVFTKHLALGSDRVGFSIHYPKSIEPKVLKALTGSKADFFRHLFEEWVEDRITIDVDDFTRQSFQFSNAKLSELHNEIIERHVKEGKIPSKAALIHNLLQQFVDNVITLPDPKEVYASKAKYVYFGVQIPSDLDKKVNRKLRKRLSKTSLISFLVFEYVGRRLRYKP